MKKKLFYAGMIGVMLLFVFVLSGCETILDQKEYYFMNKSSYDVTLHDNRGDKVIPKKTGLTLQYDIINRIEDVRYSPSDKVDVNYDEVNMGYIFYDK